MDGKYKLMYLDEYVDDLLRKDIVCEITLPRIQKRIILEELGRL